MIDVSKSNEKSAKITEQKMKAKEESENKEILKMSRFVVLFKII